MSVGSIGRVILIVGLSAFILALAGIIGLSTYFLSFPIVPNPMQGLVVPWNFHGVNHYISDADNMVFQYTYMFFWAMFFVTIIGGYLAPDVKR